MKRKSILIGPVLGCGLLLALAGCEERYGTERNQTTQEQTATPTPQEPLEPEGQAEVEVEEGQVEEGQEPEQLGRQRLTQIGVEQITFEGEVVTLPESSLQRIRQFAQRLQQEPDVKVRIESRVQELTNQEGAQQRAAAVAQVLSQQGFDFNKISMFIVQPVEASALGQAQEPGESPSAEPTEPGAEPGAEPEAQSDVQGAGQGIVELIPVYEGASTLEPQG